MSLGFPRNAANFLTSWPACKPIYVLHFPRLQINELLWLTEWPMHWHFKNDSAPWSCFLCCYYNTRDKLFDSRSQLLSTSAFSRVNTFVSSMAKSMVTSRILAWEHTPSQCTRMQPNASCLRHSQLAQRNRHSCEYRVSNCIHSHDDCYDLHTGQSVRSSL